MQHGTDVATLVSMNGLANANVLSVGQQLQVPGGGGDAAAPSGGAQTSPSRLRWRMITPSGTS